jgi:mannose-6-phosphate isomerase-like protein (cupin superfamily)
MSPALPLLARGPQRVMSSCRAGRVSRMGYTLVNHDDPTVESFRGAFYKMRKALGTNAFGINEIRLPAGAQGVEHDESDTGHEEVYVVLEGAGTFAIDGESVAVGEGDYLRVDASATRQVTAGGDGLVFLAVAGQPKPEYDGRSSL